MNLEFIFVVSSAVFCLLSMIFGTFGLYAIIRVIAMEKSTHDVQYVPLDPREVMGDAIKGETDPKKMEEELMKPFTDIEDDQF
jgi:hypothetical protein